MMRNYLRVRGEYTKDRIRLQRCRELPPRARRIPSKTRFTNRMPGTTSACAENTKIQYQPTGGPQNYLRVRGEYLMGDVNIPPLMELPPRARRIPRLTLLARLSYGTTSACAENTSTSLVRCNQNWNYLRVRGEYSPFAAALALTEELPPRARRIPSNDQRRIRLQGTTSACAENTLNELGLL